MTVVFLQLLLLLVSKIATEATTTIIVGNKKLVLN